jgi:hypothetical protein
MTGKLLAKTLDFLMTEGGLVRAQAKAKEAQKLRIARQSFLVHLKEVGKSGDLSLIVTTEKAIIKDELKNHANSKGMVSSLNAALAELTAIEKLLTIVDDKHEYGRVDQSHILPRNREKGLPLDEARQAFRSHYARLGNLEKARLSDDEKIVIEARRSNMRIAARHYTDAQAKTLGVSVQAVEIP